ncbi:uroporphyrinogen-III synthase [Bordetella genomosp. 9]|uniref:Uroporphyrinogen-III synthase n=1 Tax=Bordetella genomosp. 9 TaxID=1416803 RepID=A0A1W6Z194_9BORD|nr:uroporphyrinogen-III synthase [Bordetella genomosp. 9]ARP87137.1 hypothetical protein CAL13_13660 [Bordetella genomosp. 9]
MKPDASLLAPARAAGVAVLTRPAGRNDDLSAALRAAGWDVCVWPALRIEPAAQAGTVPLPAEFDLAVFVSGNAALHYLEQLERCGVDHWPSSCAAAAVGPATADRLRASGWLGKDCDVIHPPREAPRQDSEALWECLLARGPLPRRVLLVRGLGGRDWLAQRLLERGVQVQHHEVYRRVAAAWDADVRLRLGQWARADVRPTWLLTSGESIDAVAANVLPATSAQWWANCRFVVTHPRLAPRLAQAIGRTPAHVTVCAPADDALLHAFVSG